MGEFSLTHILLFAGVLLLFFGPKRLPALGSSIGQAIKGFKRGLNEIDAEVKPVRDTREQLSTPQPTAQVYTQPQAQKETAPPA